MLVPFTPFLWSMIQVALLAAVALIISWSLRGRCPQGVSAMLAGSCIAAMVLTGLAWLPMNLWSITKLNFESHSHATSIGYVQHDTAQRTNVSSSSSRNRIEAAQTPGHQPLQKDTPTNPSSSVGEWMGTASNWLSFHVQGIDSTLRNLEAAPNSKHLWQLQMIALALMGLLFGLWLTSWLWIRTIVRHSDPIVDSDALHLLRSLTEQIGLSRLPQFLESNRVPIGATVGVWQQRLILNVHWKQWSREELEAVLLHELAHISRHDYAWVVLGSWIRMLLFYHPLVHLLVRRWRMEQELAADQLAAGAMQNARAYGRALARLALRAQGGAKVPSPALAAEQICVTRRITMLKQGSLKPLEGRWRWSAVIVALTLVVSVPLSSLRGTPPSTPPDPPEAAGTAEEKLADATTSTTPEREERIKAHEEFLLTQKVFPPLTYTGRLKWAPNQLLSDEVSPSLRYMQDLVAFVFFEQLPADLKLQAAANATMNWENRERERGRLTFGATCNESQGMDPKFILRLLTSPFVSDYKLSTEKKVIAGYDAVRLISRYTPDEQEPHWFVREGDHVFVGTERQIVDQVKDKFSDVDNTELIAVPDVFRQDYADAGFALVYDNCHQWSDRLRDFFTGSPKQNSLIFIQPYLRDLERIGVFLTGKGGVDLSIRIGYRSETAAQDGAEAVATLIEFVKTTADDSATDLITRDILEAMRIQTVGNEVRVQFSDARLVGQLCTSLLPEKITGWTDILSLVEPSDGPGAVKLACRDNFALTGFLAQSIQAKAYRGKRIRVSAEIGANEDVHSRCGAIIWGSDSNLRTVGNATSGKTIGQPVDPMNIFKLSNTPNDRMIWRVKAVEWNVPENCEAISFGTYLASGEIEIRNVKFEVLGPAGSNSTETELANLPRNVLQIPGRALLDAPVNLDFSEKSTTTDSATQSASRPSSTQTRR